jgi:hypothetical protein
MWRAKKGAEPPARNPGTEVAPGRPLGYHAEGKGRPLASGGGAANPSRAPGDLPQKRRIGLAGGEYSRGPDPMRLMAGPRIFWRGDLCPVLWGPL